MIRRGPTHIVGDLVEIEITDLGCAACVRNKRTKLFMSPAEALELIEALAEAIPEMEDRRARFLGNTEMPAPAPWAPDEPSPFDEAARAIASIDEIDENDLDFLD